MRYKFESPFRLIDTCVLLFLTIALAGCEKELPPHPASHYPAFYGKIAYQDSLYSPVAQEKTERVFHAPATEKVLQFVTTPDEGAVENAKLYNLVRAAVNPENQELYVADIETQLLYVFSLDNGSLLRTISTLKDFSDTINSGFSLHVTSEQELIASNSKNGKYTRLDLAGKVLDNLEAKYGYSFTVADQGNQVVLTAMNEDELFHVYDKEQNLINSFGYLVSERQLRAEGKEFPGHGLGFIGYLNSDGGNSFVYSNATGGGLAKFRLNGSLDYYRELIEPGKYYRMKPSSSGQSTALDTEGKVGGHFRGVNVSGSTYYQQALMEEEGEKTWVFDAYDYESGEYLYSIKEASDECATLIITDQHQYVNCPAEGLYQMKRSLAFESVGDSAVLTENSGQ